VKPPFREPALREPATAGDGEDRYRQLVEICPDTILVHSGRRILFVNRAGLELVGARSIDEIVGHSLTDFVPMADRADLLRTLRRLRRTGEAPPVFEQQLLRLDGTHCEVEIVSQATTYQGKPAIQAVIRDITRRAEAEQALRESERRFRDLFEGVPVGIYRIARDGSFEDVNRALVSLLGYEGRHQLIGFDSGRLYVEEEDREAWRLLMEHEGEVLDFETRIYRRDGSTLWVRSHTRAMADENGRVIGYKGTVEDIGARKQAEERLRQSEERFRSLVQNTSDIISLVDQAGKLLYQSPSGRRFSGDNTRQRLGRDAFERILPEDRPGIRKRFHQLLENGEGTLRVEYRMRHRNGDLRVCESIFTNQLDNPAVAGVVVTTRDVTDRKRAEERLAHAAQHDALTGLPNRSLFMERLGECVTRRRRGAVLFIDLDHFKAINDRLGHLAGDRLLIETGRRLEGCLRPGDTLARLGGDEFAILLENVPHEEAATNIARRILEALAPPLGLEGQRVRTTASLGIALALEGTDRPDDLLRHADTAMYRAKAQGRSGFAFYDAELDEGGVEQDRRQSPETLDDSELVGFNPS
jgi:diguanylate cyclase (GGDEF)-like protein/PAS domain S-box-containing protein